MSLYNHFFWLSVQEKETQKKLRVTAILCSTLSSLQNFPSFMLVYPGWKMAWSRASITQRLNRPIDFKRLNLKKVALRACGRQKNTEAAVFAVLVCLMMGILIMDIHIYIYKPPKK